MLRWRARTTASKRFRDRGQRAAVCRAFLARAGIPSGWNAEGPMLGLPRHTAEELRSLAPGTLPVLLLCFAIWDETAILAFSDVLDLDGAQLEAVGDLLRAIARGPEAIDGWLLRWEPAPTAALG